MTNEATLKKMLNQMLLKYLDIKEARKEDDHLMLVHDYNQMLASIIDDLKKIDGYCKARNRY